MVPIVSQCIPIKGRSGNNYQAKCPFHDDTDPSLTIYEDHAHCFGCGWHGDAIKFLRDLYDLSFREAVDWINSHGGNFEVAVRIPSSKVSNPIYPIPYEVLRFWHENTRRDYYYSRMFDDATIDRFMLGYSLGRNAYVLPIWEGLPGESDVFSVRFRNADPEAKLRYWGFRGRNQPRLFNAWSVNEATEVFIFFGEFDALLAHQDGLTAVSGTSGKETWLSAWNRRLSNVRYVFVIADYGETTAAYNVASNFIGRSIVWTFPKETKDYTLFRQNGNSVNDFLSLVRVNHPRPSVGGG